jgi:Flp pilus assembly CpaF family ATPase
VTLSVYEIEDRADRAVRFLEAAVAAGLNLLVAGGTQVGNPIRCEDTR